MIYSDCVATYMISGRNTWRNSWVTWCTAVWITMYGSWITMYGSWITMYGSWITMYGSWIIYLLMWCNAVCSETLQECTELTKTVINCVLSIIHQLFWVRYCITKQLQITIQVLRSGLIFRLIVVFRYCHVNLIFQRRQHQRLPQQHQRLQQRHQWLQLHPNWLQQPNVSDHI